MACAAAPQAALVLKAPPRHSTTALLDLPWDMLESIAQLLPLKDR